MATQELELVQLGLAQAFVYGLNSLPEEQKKLSIALAEHVNIFGRTVDDDVSYRGIYLPTKQRSRLDHLDPQLSAQMADQVGKPIYQSWNRSIFVLGRIVIHNMHREFTVAYLRSPEFSRDKINFYSGPKPTENTIFIIKTVFAQTQ